MENAREAIPPVKHVPAQTFITFVGKIFRPAAGGNNGVNPLD
jgi:hypothetical protein